VLITPAYARENARLHTVDPTYGVEGHLWAYLIAGIARLENCRSVLDYGCGKGTLAKALAGTDLCVTEYDPGIPGKDSPPVEQSDLVVALDVMEHIEPGCFDAVMGDLARLTGNLLFVVAVTKPSKRIMADGRDTHLTLRDDAWWRAEFTKRGFAIRRVWNTGLRSWVALMQAPCFTS
jgi:hypothetical protein